MSDVKDFGGLVGLNISLLDSTMIMRLAPVISKAKHIRQLGAVALELCYLSCGILDAYIDFRSKVRPTDLAAGYLIAKEAGAKIFSADGTELDSELGLQKRLSLFAATKKGEKEFGPSLFSDQE